MKSVILQAAAKLLFPGILAFAVYFLLRGHNLPGGGFISGLLSAAAFILWSLSFSARAARKKLHVHPRIILGAGLLIALLSGFVGVISGAPFMTGVWGPSIPLPFVGKVGLGTPFVFDIGVFLIVWGITLLVVLSLHDLTQGESRRAL